MWRHILGFGYLILYLRLFKAPLLFSAFGFLPHFLVGFCSLFMPERIGLRQTICNVGLL
jgi:hypothetical protein